MLNKNIIIKKLEEKIKEQNIPVESIEIQPILTGIAVNGIKSSWKEEMCSILGIEPQSINKDLETLINDIYIETIKQLKAKNGILDLIIEDEDELELQERVKNITIWVQAFLSAFMYQKSDQEIKKLPEDHQEMIDDMICITKVSHDVQETAESEQAYSQIIKYIKVIITALFHEHNINEKEQKNIIH